MVDEAWERAVEAALHAGAEGSSSPARSLTLDGAVKCMHGRLPAAEILERHQSLEHLSIAGVGVTSLEGFPRLRNLTRLTLSDNRIAGGLDHLVAAGLSSLRDLDLSNNRIQDVDDLAPLADLRLVSLDLYECPVTRVKDYRSRVFGMIRTLKYLDKMDADENERPESDDDDDDAEGEGEGEGEGEEDDDDEEDEDDGEVANGGVSHSRGGVPTHPVEENGVIDADEDESDADEVVPNGGVEHHHGVNGFRVAAVGEAPDEEDEDVDEEDEDDEDDYEVEEDDLGEEIDEDGDGEDAVVEVPDVPSSEEEEDEDDEEEVEDDEENPKPCELEYGSYCLWSTEHKEVMKDATVKRLKDQLFVARAHYPSVAKLKQQESLTRELKQNIQEHERMLSDTIADADLPPFFPKKLEKMEHMIERAKSCGIGCSNVERKLRQLLDITEDEAYFHTRQSARLYHLGVQTMPKTHHCLNMRLTVEYFKSTSTQMDRLNKQKHESPSFHNYVIFSRNVLAASTTINSTVINSKDSGSIVFHLFTDAQNFYAMKHWFDRNSYLEASVHVTNIEDHQELSKDVNSLDMQQLWPAEEFRVTIRNHSEPLQGQMKTEYISVFGHSHFLLPDLLPNLDRVVVLDDDLIVQKDLSSLWNLDMDGKVIGAVQFCGVRLGQLRAYIAEHNFNTNSCVWMSGLNIVELEKWRELRITGLYEQLLQEMQKDSLTSQQLKSLPSSLVALHDLVYPLEDSWVQSGLGHDYGISHIDIENAATLHYNGVMKPWLDLGIHDYKSYWRKYMTRGERFMTECNIH